MTYHLSKTYLYVLATLCCLLILVNSVRGQSILMSSMGMLPSTTNHAASIMFKSNTTCIDVQSGLTLFNNSKRLGEFNINCNVSLQFNVLGMKLYPNPVTTNAKLRLTNSPRVNQEFKLTIWDNQGNLMLQTKETSAQLYQGSTLSLQHLIAGSYVLRMESSLYIEAIKFIKVR